MKTTLPTVVVVSAIISIAGLITSHSATLNYAFDSTSLNGTTVLNTSNITHTNIAGTSYSFDTAVKSEGSASFRMTGTGNSTFGSFFVPLSLGLVSQNGSTQDFSSLNTLISFQYNIANTPGFTANQYGSGTPNIYIRLFEPGSTTNFVASYYTNVNAGNTSGSFLTLSTGVLATSTTLKSGWSFGSGFNASNLTDISTLSISLGYSYSSSITLTTLDYHLDNLIVSGDGISVVPEPSVSILVAAGVCGVIAKLRAGRRKIS